MPDITNKTVFARLDEFIRSSPWSDADLLQIIGGFAGVSAPVAQAMAYHARDIIVQHHTEDIEYVDIVSQVYYRTFFSPEHAGLYGTDYMIHDPARLEEFVNYCIDPSTVEVTKHAETLPTKFTTH